jgi:hypothetical protein
VAPETVANGGSPFDDINQVKPVIVSPAVVATLALKVALLVTNATKLDGWTTMLTLARVWCAAKHKIRAEVQLDRRTRPNFMLGS